MNLKVSDAKREEGFTLIELLVVVIIIGILAAIAIPVFLNQRERAWNAAAQSDLRNAAVAMETYFTDTSQYTSAQVDLENVGFNNSENVNFGVATPTEGNEAGSTAYCMSATHENSDTIWELSSEVGAPAEVPATGTACS